MLTLDRANEVLRYDPESGQLIWKMSLSSRSSPGTVAGCKSSNGYIRIKIDGAQYLAHRIAWLLLFSEWPPGPLDHIDTCRHNNAIRNLRLCTGSQNQQNQTLRKSNRSGVKGVSWCQKQSRWYVQIRAPGKIHQGGLFIDIDDAKAAAIQLRTKLHGEFARHE